ncbi:hypothetical protein [Georgenia sp. AZ-5]|uniref:hypothetical protein n=1 Tax=Georgenia sp. AZ-5 TaxID=3367526 RepID=UPI0037540F3F
MSVIRRRRPGTAPPASGVLPAAAFWVPLTLVIACYAVLAWQQLDYGLEFDDAYNLTVVENLAEGRGYASNGTIFEGGLKPFDEYISTGPVLLVPTAVMWWLTDGALWAVRLPPLAFFALYLVFLWKLGRGAGGRWGALAAVVAPLTMAVAVHDLTTLSLVPGRLVGEFAACGLVVGAAYALSRGHPLFGGLLAGLAVQTKIVFVVAGAAVLLASLAGRWVAGRPWPWRHVLLCVAGAALPTVAFELFRLSQLGVADYVANITQFAGFVEGQTTEAAPDIKGRIGSVAPIFSIFGLAIVAHAVLVLAAAATLSAPRRAPDTPAHATPHTGEAPAPSTEPAGTRSAVRVSPRLSWLTRLSSTTAPTGSDVTTAATGLFLAGLAQTALWLFVSQQTSSRQGLPAILLCVPVVLVAATVALRDLRRRSTGRGRAFAGVMVALAWASAVTLVAWQGWKVSQDPHGDLLRAEQERGASAVLEADTPSLPVDGWWQLHELQVLTDVPPSTTPGTEPPTVLVFNSIRALVETGRPDARVFLDRCGSVLEENPTMVVCQPPSPR